MSKRMKKNDVSSYFFYMWNAWCEEECQAAFAHSACGWRHFWEKWGGICNKHGIWGAAERFYVELSENNRDLLVQRACAVYDRNRRIKKNPEQ